MGSSNKHWPSMFKKSNYQNSQHGNKSSIWSIGEERNPEPKPRWNPRPEQIRILEDIFNSGMVNPSKEEIKKIRAQLQEYGQVGDANVFYWFQNRKSRSKNKHKQRQPYNNIYRTRAKNLNQNPITPPNSSSSNHQNDTALNQNQTGTAYVHTPVETGFSLPGPPLFSSHMEDISYGVPSSNSSNNDSTLPPLPSITIDESPLPPPLPPIAIDDSALPPLPPVTIGAPVAHSFPITDQFQGVGEADEDDDEIGKCIVSINGHVLKVDKGPFNVRGFFGDEAVLIDSFGQLVLTDEWGVTLNSLQHGASYYMI